MLEGVLALSSVLERGDRDVTGNVLSSGLGGSRYGLVVLMNDTGGLLELGNRYRGRAQTILGNIEPDSVITEGVLVCVEALRSICGAVPVH